MRSQYTPIYYRKSPVPSRELYTNPARSTHNFVVTQLCAPAHRGVPTYYLLISLDLRAITRTAHKRLLMVELATLTSKGQYFKTSIVASRVPLSQCFNRSLNHTLLTDRHRRPLLFVCRALGRSSRLSILAFSFGSRILPIPQECLLLRSTLARR